MTMLSYKIEKNFRFEAAHRLGKGYEGKCRNLHGHSWTGSVAILVAETDEYDMAVDFADLGGFLKIIEKLFDHKVIVYAKDMELLSYLVSTRQEYVGLNTNPTCEAIAAEIHSQAVSYFKANKKIQVDSVTIKETCTTACTFKFIPDEKKQPKGK